MNPARILTLAALFAVASPQLARAQQKPLPNFTESEAGKHSGEEAAVTGKVVAVSKSSKGTTYLNFGDRFPRQTFSGVVLTRDAEKVGDVNTYEGKVVTVTGRIELSQDQKPQIVIRAPSQIKLSEPGEKPAPMPPPQSATAAQPAIVPVKPAEVKKIALAANWNRPTQGSEMTRKDLASLFGGQGAASENAEGDPSVVLFGDVPFLAPLAVAKKRLQLEGVVPSVVKVTCPGLPLDSFFAHAFSGVFPGGFNHLYLVADKDDQVVSVLLVDDNSRQRTPNAPDTTGYHTYNFINGRSKGNSDLVIRHQIAAGASPGVVVVDSMLIDPRDPEPGVKPGSTSRTTTSSRTPRTGKVMERSRWIVPAPVVNLILRCVGNR